ncbi:stalk domain-containing protein [Clostridium sp. MD294]|uniref:stalk domain-containing protein n=1 Tax=Clostridium sp. MD294 TaxID=97138 RepID=UPI0002CA15AA|nr:stalk domain-containing protein [Clostridium sp. MD294]NDO47337.1 copper amine oxidase N-terminal domain-containing protein [Clostridium sp. MD294]USF29595.1 hypothetical protein C820_000995 [Clostridium sp. MD294]
MKKKLLTCILCTFVFTCSPFITYHNSTGKVFAVNSAFSSILLETTSIKEVTGPTNLAVFRIKDKSGAAIPKDTIYSLKLDNGFIFQNKPEILSSGKYRDKVFFEIDYQNPSIAYITIQKKTDASDGVIEFQNLDITPTRNSEINKDITLYLSGNNTYDTIKVGTYKEAPATQRTPITIKTLENSKKPYATGTSAANRKLQILIDGEEYGTVTAGEDGLWNYTFPYKYSPLETGTHTFTIGYYQGTTTLIGSVSKEFEIAPEVAKTTKTVIFTVGEKTYTYDGRTGYLEAAPFIDNNGNVLLPLRAVAGTLNIDAQNIIWNTESQTITIKQSAKTICYTIGSNIMTINGVASEMNTAPIVQNGVTFLPLRSLLNSLGITDNNIQWDNNTQIISYEV